MAYDARTGENLPQNLWNEQGIKQEELRDLWSTLPAEQEVAILDDNGQNIASASMRPLPDGRWLYQDNVDGFEIFDREWAAFLLNRAGY